MIFDSGKQGGVTRRRLRFALGASLAIHGLLLMMGAFRPPLPVVAPRLLASLQPAPAFPAVTEPALPAPPVAAPIRRHVVQREKSHRAANPAVPSAPTFPASAPAQPVADTAPKGAVENAAPASAAPTSAPLAEAMSAPAESAASLSADGLRRYRLSLAAQARRFKRYPAQALAAGWAGTAEIRLEIGGDGQGSATLSRSSGYAVLDRAAQAMIEQGAQRTPVPEALRGKAFSVVLPVLFDINDGG